MLQCQPCGGPWAQLRGISQFSMLLSLGTPKQFFKIYATCLKSICCKNPRLYVLRFAESERRVSLRKYKLATTFNATDELLQQLEVWPNVSNAEYYQTKNKFQLQNVLYR